MKIQTGDLWLVKFHPGTGAEFSKYRPALIISDLQKIEPRFSLIAPLTSDTQKRNEFEFEIKHDALEKPSLLLGWYIWTIDSRRLITKLGAIQNDELQPILSKIRHLIKT